jgi:hypothetical protein
MDQLQLIIRFEQAPTEPEGKLYLGVEAVVNGQLVAAIHYLPLDLVALRASAKVPDKYYLWSCTCGIPECAGIWEPVAVTHEAETISWHCNARPLEDFGMLKFDKATYQHALTRLLEQLQYELSVRRAIGEQFEWVIDQEDALFDRNPWEGPPTYDRPRPSRGKPFTPLKPRK